MYYDSLLPERQRAKWVVFESPTGQPWSYGGVTAAHSNDCNCKCSDIEQCLRDGKSPLIWPNGLVAQHNCSSAVERLSAWEKVRAHPACLPNVIHLLAEAWVSQRHLCAPDEPHTAKDRSELLMLLCLGVIIVRVRQS